MPAKTDQPTSQPKNAAASTKLPVKTFRLGCIKSAVWENEADRKKFYNVTFARTYVDDGNSYHDTDSFGRDDLPLVAKLADQAHTFIFDQLAKTGPGRRGHVAACSKCDACSIEPEAVQQEREPAWRERRKFPGRPF